MKAISVEFPLRGEWIAPITPSYKIPTHGNDLLAQTYAYDLMQIDWRYPKSLRFYMKPYFLALLIGVRLKECLSWSQPIYAPFDAEIIDFNDGVQERNPIHFLFEEYVRLKTVKQFLKNRNFDVKRLLGNYIILEGEHCFALFAHIRTGSISGSLGKKVKTGEKLAEVGHSGNSNAPHLHFQLMDGNNIKTAKGLLCCFREYEVYEKGAWLKIKNGIPGRFDRIRVV